MTGCQTENVIVRSPQISDVLTLDALEGGMVTENEQCLAILYENNSNIESLITGTLRSSISQWQKIDALLGFQLSSMVTSPNSEQCLLFMLSKITKATGIMLTLQMML